MVLYYNMWLISVLLASMVVVSASYTAIRGHPLIKNAKSDSEYREAREWVVEKCAGTFILILALAAVFAVRISGDMFVHIEYDKSHVFYEYDNVDMGVFSVTVYPLLFPVHEAEYFSCDTDTFVCPEISIKAEGMLPKAVRLERFIKAKELKWKYRDKKYIVRSEGVEDGLLSCDVVYMNGFINRSYAVHLDHVKYNSDGTARLDLTLNGITCVWKARVLPED